ncbi:MAG: polysaccharide deacetylase family protein, partial [Solirubrobacterales bacterium]|nr:polysaccharide deacetylase family protein [Solirubrobacterales bacterium]
MRRVAVLLAAGCLALAGCGGDDEELSATVTTSAPEAAT